jgi:purine-cytosine permease-like protein
MASGDEDVTATSTYTKRVADEVETVGVLPVPDEQRTMRPRQLFIVWLMVSASATTPLVGQLLFPYGLYLLIGAIVVAFLIGVLPAGVFSEMGREVPLSALVVARKTFGWDGSFLFSVLFTVVNLGWFGLNTAVGASILASVTHSSELLWDGIVGCVQIVLVIFGMKWLERFYRYTTLLLIVCYGALAVYLVAHYSLHLPAQTKPMNWGSAVTNVLSFSLLVWTYKLSTVSRFCVPVSQTGGRRPSYFFAASTGVMVAVLVMGVIGAYAQQATGNWDIALLGSHIGGWGWIAAFGVAVAVLHTNAMNLYPSVIDLLVALNNVRVTGRWLQPVATIVLGVAGVALAAMGILANAETFLDDAGDLIIPFTFVMLADWMWVQRRRTASEAFFEPPVSALARWKPSAFVAFLVGFVVSFWGQDFLPGFFYDILPLPVVGGVLSAAIYAAIAAPRTRSRSPESSGSVSQPVRRV